MQQKGGSFLLIQSVSVCLLIWETKSINRVTNEQCLWLLLFAVVMRTAPPPLPLIYWSGIIYLFIVSSWMQLTSLQVEVFLFVSSVYWTGGQKLLKFVFIVNVFLSLLVVTNSFSGFGSVGWHLWFLSLQNTDLGLLDFRVSVEKAGVILIDLSLYTTWPFPLKCLMSMSFLCSLYSVFYYVWWGISLLVQCIPGVLYVSCTLIGTAFFRLGEIFFSDSDKNILCLWPALLCAPQLLTDLVFYTSWRVCPGFLPPSPKYIFFD